MLFVELALSACTLVSIWMITNRKRYGVAFGLVMQLCWVYLWIFVTQQFGFVLLDLCICCVFADRLLRGCRAWNRFIDRHNK